ncbi:MAG: SOS response-associated peptidase family protein [Microbacteriaceae bacterium]|jgi:putative SOS response-associated peptidase YedK|nr:SOS response-associated peptidase family protein [Microbacteriaceae bacterium]HPZ34153.1 SOS response-associated peptidase family protein [Microbacteriaceae bacterium]HQC93504.1 SOS response-associated peptidase family protein [Microbacteriaceae bacterium]
MCASYGLDPRFSDPERLLADDVELVDALRAWAAGNAGETLLPTGRHLRNLNPIIRDAGAGRRLDLGWWGYLVAGAPAKFSSINTRAERLASGRGPLPERAIVPATFWREMLQPSRVWHHFAADGDALLGMAAVTRPGRTADGAEFTCYSIVMQPAAAHLARFHDRMPVLVGAGFAQDWLAPGQAAPGLIDAAMDASAAVAATIRVTAEPGGAPDSGPAPQGGPGGPAPDRLF